jgi:hypothetical protein
MPGLFYFVCDALVSLFQFRAGQGVFLEGVVAGVHIYGPQRHNPALESEANVFASSCLLEPVAQSLSALRDAQSLHLLIVEPPCLRSKYGPCKTGSLCDW